MPIFFLGLLLGGLSGGGTYWLTQDGGLATLIGVVAAIVTWCGVAVVVVLDA